VNERAWRHADYFAGGYALGGIVLHDAAHFAAGRWYDAFWVCNVAALLVAPAVLSRSPMLATVALTWLLPGTLVWLTDVFVAGSTILPTSYNVHLGGALAAVYGVWRSGHAKKSWLLALAFLALTVIVSRLLLPAEHNVNAVHRVPPGWSFLGENRGRFVLVAIALSVALCAFGQGLARLLARGKNGTPAA
jgi:hypothetical protein